MILTITINKDMMNIESSNMYYGNIEDSGWGCQLDDNLENRRTTIENTCTEIADQIYLLQKLLTV